jgi:hypothetical protein
MQQTQDERIMTARLEQHYWCGEYVAVSTEHEVISQPKGQLLHGAACKVQKPPPIAPLLQP